MKQSNPTTNHQPVSRSATWLTLLLCLVLPLQPVLAGEITYYHTDASGSPVMASDAQGNIIWREHYQPYGEKVNEPLGEDIGYTGHEYDAETGLTYMQARYYDPVVGRFLAIDPVGFKPKQPMTFNRYSYANNNPYKYHDPDGEFAILTAILISAAVGAAISGGVEAYSQYSSSGEVSDWGSVGVEAAKGAAIGGVSAAGGAAMGTMAAAKGASTLIQYAATAAGSATGAGAATLVASPAADSLTTGEMKPTASYVNEAGANVLGSVVGGSTGKGLTKGLTTLTKTSASDAGMAGSITSEAVGAGVTEGITADPALTEEP